MIMRFVLFIVLLYFFVSTQQSRSEIKAEIIAERECLQNAITGDDVDACFALMDANNKRRFKD